MTEQEQAIRLICKGHGIDNPTIGRNEAGEWRVDVNAAGQQLGVSFRKPMDYAALVPGIQVLAKEALRVALAA